jgi:hypothetical protein
MEIGDVCILSNKNKPENESECDLSWWHIRTVNCGADKIWYGWIKRQAKKYWFKC